MHGLTSKKISLGLSRINQINIYFILYISAHQKSWLCIWRIQVNKDTFSTFPMNSLLKYMTPSWKQVWFLILNVEAAYRNLVKFTKIYFNFQMRRYLKDFWNNVLNTCFHEYWIYDFFSCFSKGLQSVLLFCWN